MTYPGRSPAEIPHQWPLVLRPYPGIGNSLQLKYVKYWLLKTSRNSHHNIVQQECQTVTKYKNHDFKLVIKGPNSWMVWSKKCFFEIYRDNVMPINIVLKCGKNPIKFVGVGERTPSKLGKFSYLRLLNSLIWKQKQQFSLSQILISIRICSS